MDPQNPWYQPGNSYGATPGWDQTQFVQGYLDPTIPRGVYQSYLSQNGFGGMDRRSTWAQNQYGNTQTGYQAALRQNPALSYLDYLNQQFGGQGGLNHVWRGLAPEQHGENVTRWTGPTRIIPWG